MNDNKGMRLLQWVIVLLVLCNIGLVLTIWLKPHHDGPPRGEGPRNFVISNLKFSDEQVKKYDELIKAHRQAMDQLGKEGSEYRRQLFENLKNEQQSGNYSDSMAQLIANNQKQVELATYRHFAQVRAICDNAQKETFDKIINDVAKKMHGGPAPGHRGSEEHHPGDGQGPPPGPGENP